MELLMIVSLALQPLRHQATRRQYSRSAEGLLNNRPKQQAPLYEHHARVSRTPDGEGREHLQDNRMPQR